MFIRTRSLSNAFRWFIVNVRINIISEPFGPVKKSNSLISNCTAAKILSSFCIILTKQQTLSVARPFDSSLALYYKRSIVTMCLSCTVMEIWRLQDNGVTSLTFWGHVTSLVMKERWEKGKRKGEGRERESGREKGRERGRRKGKEVKGKGNGNGKGKG